MQNIIIKTSTINLDNCEALELFIEAPHTPDNTTFTILVDCTITFHALLHITRALSPFLVKWDFHYYGPDFPITTLTLIMDTIPQWNTLTGLSVAKGLIGDEGVEIICEHLKTDSTLKELDLSQNRVLPKGINSLAMAFITNQSLQSLSLAYNRHIDDKSLTKLIGVLKNNNRSLTHLDLSWMALECGKKTKWIVKLNQFLKVSPALSAVNLSGNNLFSLKSLEKTIGLIDNRFLFDKFIFIQCVYANDTDLKEALKQQSQYMHTRLSIVSKAIEPILLKPVRGILWSYMNASSSQLTQKFIKSSAPSIEESSQPIAPQTSTPLPEVSTVARASLETPKRCVSCNIF